MHCLTRMHSHPNHHAPIQAQMQERANVKLLLLKGVIWKRTSTTGGRKEEVAVVVVKLPGELL
jgi:hypothetical protein